LNAPSTILNANSSISKAQLQFLPIKELNSYRNKKIKSNIGEKNENFRLQC
jgi:hypothetical protein